MSSDPSEIDVSIVIPAWGEYAGRPLSEALESIRAQDLPTRVIVVDNASDAPVGAAPDVELVRAPERLTVGAARNLGLEAVTTPYVLFWDADDLMPPGTLRFLRDRLAAEPDAVLVAASILEGEPPVPHRWPRRWTHRLARFRRVYALLHCVWSLFPSTGSSLMRTSAARQAGFGDADSGEDWVLGVSLVFRGRIVLEERPGRIYRRHADSLWERQRSAQALTRHARAVRERLARDPGVPRSARLLLPLIGLLQLGAIRVIRPLVEATRAIRTNRRSVA